MSEPNFYILDIETGIKHQYSEPKEALEIIKNITKGDACSLTEVLGSLHFFGESALSVYWIVDKLLKEA